MSLLDRVKERIVVQHLQANMAVATARLEEARKLYRPSRLHVTIEKTADDQHFLWQVWDHDVEYSSGRFEGTLTPYLSGFSTSITAAKHEALAACKSHWSVPAAATEALTISLSWPNEEVPAHV